MSVKIRIVVDEEKTEVAFQGNGLKIVEELAYLLTDNRDLLRLMTFAVECANQITKTEENEEIENQNIETEK